MIKISRLMFLWDSFSFLFFSFCRSRFSRRYGSVFRDSEKSIAG